MLPDGWKSGKLGDQLNQIIDYRGTSVPKAKSGIPLITARNVRKGFLDLSTTEYIDPDSEKEWMSRGYPHAGDILFTTEAPLGNVAKFPEQGTFCIGQRVVALRAKKDILASDFLLYQLLSDKGQDLIDERSSGSTAKGIKTKELRKISILLPPLPEQKKIAAILSTWDRAIEGTEKLLANSQQQKKALMQQLLTGKKRLPGFTGEWKKHRLSDCCHVVMGSSPKSEFYNETGEGLPLLQGNADIKNRLSCPRIFTSEITKECQLGDILLSVRAPVGTVSIALHHACIGRGISSIRVKNGNSQEFAYQYFLSIEDRWDRLAQGSTFEAVNGDDIKKLTIQLPSFPEQKAIAAVLTTADEEITAIESDLSRLRQEKKALMQQLLTGKRRVTVD